MEAESARDLGPDLDLVSCCVMILVYVHDLSHVLCVLHQVLCQENPFLHQYPLNQSVGLVAWGMESSDHELLDSSQQTDS